MINCNNKNVKNMRECARKAMFKTRVPWGLVFGCVCSKLCRAWWDASGPSDRTLSADRPCVLTKC